MGFVKRCFVLFSFIHLIYTVFIFVGTSLGSQQVKMPLAVDKVAPLNADDSEEIICNVWVEEGAEYSEGADSLKNFVETNLKWPYDFCGEGTVVITFEIDKLGHASNHRVIRSVAKPLDDEAMRVVSLLKQWKPYTINGKPIRCQYNVPVKFSLD